MFWIGLCIARHPSTILGKFYKQKKDFTSRLFLLDVKYPSSGYTLNLWEWSDGGKLLKSVCPVWVANGSQEKKKNKDLLRCNVQCSNIKLGSLWIQVEKKFVDANIFFTRNFLCQQTVTSSVKKKNLLLIESMVNVSSPGTINRDTCSIMLETIHIVVLCV